MPSRKSWILEPRVRSHEQFEKASKVALADLDLSHTAGISFQQPNAFLNLGLQSSASFSKPTDDHDECARRDAAQQEQERHAENRVDTEIEDPHEPDTAAAIAAERASVDAVPPTHPRGARDDLTPVVD